MSGFVVPVQPTDYAITLAIRNNYIAIRAISFHYSYVIENKHINSFLRVLDLGSFSKAARSLNIAQPALSQHVRKLEDTLGITLLNRGARGVSPTAAGREFSGRAREILSLVDSAEKRFQSGENELFGEIRLGLPGSVCPILAPPLMISAAELFPNVKLIITELMSGDLAEMLSAGRMDAAVLFNVQETVDHTAEPIVLETLNLIGEKDALLVQEPSVSSTDLKNIPLVGTCAPHGLRLLLERWSNETNIPLQFTFEADAPSVLIRLAASGRCYSIVAKAAISNEIALGELASAEIIDPPIERTVCICSSKRLPQDNARDAIVSLLNATATELVLSGAWQGATAIQVTN